MKLPRLFQDLKSKLKDGLFKVIISFYLYYELPANWTLALHLVQEQHNAWGDPDLFDDGLKKCPICSDITSSVQSSFEFKPGLHFLGHFCKSSWFETDVVHMYRIRIRERHISILLTSLWPSIGEEALFVDVVDVADPVDNDEVFVVVAIDAGFFVLVVDVFAVNSVIDVVNFVDFDVVVDVVDVDVVVVAIVFNGVVNLFVVDDDGGVVRCCDVVALELVVGGSLRASIKHDTYEENIETSPHPYEINQLILTC